MIVLYKYQVYWLAAEANSTIPKIWPENLATEFNIANPMHTVVNNISYGTYISVCYNFK